METGQNPTVSSTKHCGVSHPRLSRVQTLWLHEKQPFHFLVCVLWSADKYLAAGMTLRPIPVRRGAVVTDVGCAGTWAQEPLQRVVPPACPTSASSEAKIPILQMDLLKKKKPTIVFAVGYPERREENSCGKVPRSMEW